MKYTEEYAMLIVKKETLENILVRIDNKEKQIRRYEDDENCTDSWYKEQIHFLSKEIEALKTLAKIIAK